MAQDARRTAATGTSGSEQPEVSYQFELVSLYVFMGKHQAVRPGASLLFVASGSAMVKKVSVLHFNLL